MAGAVPIGRAAAVLSILLACGCASKDAQSGAEAADSFKPSFPYRFEGNVSVKSKDLIAAAATELRAFETQGRKAADLDDAAYVMRREIRREGYAHAKVTVRAEPSTEDIASVTFVMEEGPKTQWGAIEFPGAQSFDEARLRQFFTFEPKKKGLLAPDEEKPPFRASDLDAGIARVQGLYLREGWYRVKVGPPKIAWSEDRGVANITIPIEENRRYTVGEVDVVIDGTLESADSVRAAAQAFVGQPYDARVPVRVAIAVRAVLAKEGRVLMKVEPTAVVDDATATAAVKVKLTPGPQVRIAGVDVRGNERTRTDFLLGQAKLEAGELLTGERIERAFDGLYATGLFKSVRIEPVVPEGTESRPADESYDAQVAVVVEELMAKSVDFEVGWGSYELLMASVRYRDRNLFGTGRDFEFEPAASVKSVGADVRFFDRYILGKNNTLEFLSGVLLREEPSYDLVSFRNELAVRRRFSEAVMGRAGYRFVMSNASDIHVKDESQHDTTITSGPFATFEIDRRDNPILPSSGYFVAAGAAISLSALGANVDFLDLFLEASGYRRLGEDLVLTGNVRLQTRPTLDGSDTLPIQERLFLGGANSVRSFGEDELGPSDGSDPIGGLTALDATVELRQRIWGDLYGAVFYDIGTVSPDAFDAGRFGHAIGAGLRYYLPMGPVRLDVGYNPGFLFAADSDVAIHFSFGFSF